MKGISKKKFMVFGMKRGITYVIDWKNLTIIYCDLIWTFVLRLDREIVEIDYEMI